MAYEKAKEAIGHANNGFFQGDELCGEVSALLKHLENLDKVYEKYKHLDDMLSDKEGAGSFIEQITQDLWQAVKSLEEGKEAVK